MKVSVCMASFNGAAYIKEQLDSILVSPLVHEVIVSDDGSTDATLSIVKAIGDPRIVLIEGPQAGLIKNFENAISKATGDVVFLSDQDDVWLPQKVSRVLMALRDADMVVTDCHVCDHTLTVLHSSFFQLNRSGSGLLRNLVKNGYLGCCMAMQRRIIEIGMPFPARIAMHDWWLGLIAQKIGRVRFLDEPLSLYRRHSNNSSTTGQDSTYSLLLKLRWRVHMLLYLIVRTVRESDQ